MAALSVTKTLFVGNLPTEIVERDLLGLFGKCGRIVECCKKWCHYGFIQFATEDEARLAFENLNGFRLLGRPMRIEFQKKKAKDIRAILAEQTQEVLNEVDNQHMNIYMNRLKDDDVENISPNQTFFSHSFNRQQYAKVNDNKNIIDNDTANYSTFDIDLHRQLSFLDSGNNCNNSNSGLCYGRKITNNTHSSSLSIIASNQTPSSTNQQHILTNRSLNLVSNENEKNSSLLTNLLKNQKTRATTQPQQQQQNPIEIDARTNAWFNHLLEEASKHPSTKTTTFSLSSSPLSPNNHDCLKSNSVETSLSSNSVILYRSLNSSNTIFVQPTDILEPLEVGDFKEYILFPEAPEDSKNRLKMSSPKHFHKLQFTPEVDYDEYAKELLPPDLISPPSSVSLSSSISSSSSRHASPVLSMRRKYRSRSTQKRRETKC